MITIRKGNIDDLPTCLALIQELAVYEREPEAVTVDIDAFRQFYEEGRFELIVAVEGEQVVGMALFYEAYSTWKGKYMYLDDFVVQEQARGKGIGKQIFDTLLALVEERNMAFLKWQVLEWNEPAIRFYDRYPITKDDTWIDCKYFPIHS